MLSLDENEVRLVMSLCDKVQVVGLGSMQEVLRLAAKCQAAMRPQAEAPKPPEEKK